MPRRAITSRPPVLRLAAAMLVLPRLLVPVAATPVAAAEGGLTMTARALLQGHVRAGSWFAVAVDLENAGPTVTGELRITGGADSRTRFGDARSSSRPGSRKQYLLYALPPSFGGNMKVQLVDGRQGRRGGAGRGRAPRPDAARRRRRRREPGQDRRRARPACRTRTASRRSIATLTPGRPAGADPGLVRARPADLAGHRRLGAHQRAARGAPDLDRRRRAPRHRRRHRRAPTRWPPSPTTCSPTGRPRMLDVDPASLRPVLGGVARGRRRTLTAYAGDPGAGRVLATSGDRVIAAELTLRRRVGDAARLRPDDVLDRRGRRAGTRRCGRSSCRSARPAPCPSRTTRRSSGAVANLPSLALPPITGLLVLLFGYIILVGPVNYLVLSRLDRREWAWITVPVADRRVHRSARSGSARCCAARTSSSTRSRSSAARRAPTRRRPRPTSASSAPRARRSSCASTATPCSRRR